MWPGTAAAFPLDIGLDAHITALRACDEGDADACLGLAQTSRRAFLASIAAQARGVASYDAGRNSEMDFFATAACRNGSLEGCWLADDTAGACRLLHPEACTQVYGEEAGPLFSATSDVPRLGPFRKGVVLDPLVVSSPSTLMGSEGRSWGREGAEDTDFLWLDDGRILLREEGSAPGSRWTRPVRYTWFGSEGVELTEVPLEDVPRLHASRPSDGSELVVLGEGVFRIDPATGAVRHLIDAPAVSLSWNAGGGAVVTADAVIWLDPEGKPVDTLDRAGATAAWAAGGFRAVLQDGAVESGELELCRVARREDFAVGPDGSWAACRVGRTLRLFDGAGHQLAALPVSVSGFRRPPPVEAHGWGLTWNELNLLTGTMPALPESHWAPPHPAHLAGARRDLVVQLSDAGAGVPVYVVPAGDPLSWAAAPEDLHIFSATTDASGKARFRGLVGGEWTAYVDGLRVGVVPPQGGEMVAARRGPDTLAHRVDAPGATVAFSFLGGETLSTVAADGTFEVPKAAGRLGPRVCKGDLGAIIVGAGSGPLRSHRLHQKEGFAEQATLRFEHPDGKPVAHAFVSPYGVTDAQGRLDVHCHLDQQTLDVHGLTAVRRPSTDGVLFVLEPRLTALELRGRCSVPGDPACEQPTHPVQVVDAYGHPVPAARVEYHVPGMARGEAYTSSMLGELHVHTAPPGRVPKGRNLENGAIVRRTASERMLAQPEGDRCDSGVRVQSDDNRHYIDTPPIDEVLCPPGPAQPRQDPWWDGFDATRAIQGDWVAVTTHVERILEGRAIAAKELQGIPPVRQRQAVAALGLDPALAAHTYGWGLKQYRRQDDFGFELPTPHGTELHIRRRKVGGNRARIESHGPSVEVELDDGSSARFWFADPDTIVYFGGASRPWFEFPSLNEEWTVFERQ